MSLQKEIPGILVLSISKTKLSVDSWWLPCCHYWMKPVSFSFAESAKKFRIQVTIAIHFRSMAEICLQDFSHPCNSPDWHLLLVLVVLAYLRSPKPRLLGRFYRNEGILTWRWPNPCPMCLRGLIRSQYLQVIQVSWIILIRDETSNESKSLSSLPSRLRQLLKKSLKKTEMYHLFCSPWRKCSQFNINIQYIYIYIHIYNKYTYYIMFNTVVT